MIRARYFFLLALSPALIAANATAVEAARPHFLPAAQQKIGAGASAFVTLFSPAVNDMRGRIVLIAGASDAVRSNNPAQRLREEFALLGYANWVLLRERGDAEQLGARAGQLLSQAQAYTPSNSAKRAQALATSPGVLVLLHADAAALFGQLIGLESVTGIILLSAESPPASTLNKPILDCFAAPDRSTAYQQFLLRKQQWRGRYYRAMSWPFAADQRYFNNERWLSRQIIGWWRQQ